jgi:DNA-binding NarL/FixJ family response regulator
LSSFRIALIDGDAAIRAGRRLLIDSQDDMRVVYEESAAMVALEKVPELLVDVIVIDHRLQGMDGVSLAKELVARISAQAQRVPAVVITGSYYTFELLMASIRAGATELVTQDSPASELLDAIRKSRRNIVDIKIKPFLQFLDSNEYAPVVNPNYLLTISQLTSEQRELVDLLALGHDIDQLALNLDLARTRVRELLEECLRAFGCATIEQLYLLIRDSSKSG